MKILASIIICTRNRSHLLKRLLNSLIQQTIGQEKFEIIVVDDCSNDDTALVCDKFQQKFLNIQYINTSTNVMLSSARNIGFNAALGENILYTDDDCIVQKNWVESMIKALEKESIIAGIVASPLSNYINLSHNISQFYPFMPGKKSGHVDFIAGANMGFRHSDLKELGGFEEGRKLASDTELILRARRKGYRIYLDSNSIVIHDPKRTSLKTIFRYSSVHASQTILLRNQNRSLLRTPFVLRSPILLILTAPLIALKVTLKIYLGNIKLAKLFWTIPMVYMLKIAWCWGAARGLMKKPPAFAHLVLKPTLSCTAKCETCSTRKTLHKKKIKEKQLNISYWKKLFMEINELGLSKLTLSGGEPTLYKEIIELIKEGKKYNWEIGLNTNGSLIDNEFANRLYEAGLNSVSLSIYCASPELHDQIRGYSGLWQKVITTANIFVKIRDQLEPYFKVSMQTIICKDNFRQFPDLIRLAYKLKFCSMTFSYLEGDYKDKKYLLDEKQIREFKDEIVPEVIDIIKKSNSDKWAKKIAIFNVKSIYPTGKISNADYASGIYRSSVSCEVPSYFSIILANGDVHPCNMVEYTHFPVFGNLHKKSFTETWNSNEWAEFRKKGFDLCHYCPVPHQVIIPITRSPEYAPVQYLIQTTPMKKFHHRLKKMIFSRRRLLRIIRKN